ncbi:MAG: murein L,D-transpeptidase [Actinobacteria bacterium]|nr:murein L,D-transpeptidase [Actinomycetota bacterium]
MQRVFGRTWIWVTLGAVVGLVTVGVVALTRTDPTAPSASGRHTVAARHTTTTTEPPTTTTTIPGLTQPPEVLLPPLPSDPMGPGSSGDVVKAYQQRLADVHFDPGPIDGNYGTAMVYAVQALQKILGTERTGRLTGAEAAALATFQYPTPLQPDGEAQRAEIDITKQVMTLYEGYQVRLITTVSTGSGESYCYNTPRVNPTRRVCEYANTPSGRYTFREFRRGWDKSPLGQLYNPFYFNGGIAVHGYQSVPTSPASHGCTRIPMHIADYFHNLVKVGDAVYVFGGKPAQIISSSPISAAPVTTAPPATAPPATTPPATEATTTTTAAPVTTTTTAPPGP